MSQVGLIQMTSSQDPNQNLAWIESEIRALVAIGVDWIVLPENALVFGSTKDYHQYAEILGEGPLQDAISNLAKHYQIWILIGSMPIQAKEGVTTTSIIYDAKGKQRAHYDKLHLFDVDVDDGHKSYRESDSFVAGNRVVTQDTPFGQIGLTVCYDLRFPILFQALKDQGAQIIVVPAAFTYVTGQAHWEVLLRARAIETQCWIIGVGQTGKHNQERQTWGHSMVINPWGEIVASLSETAGHITATIDTKQNGKLKQQMPLHQHRRFQYQLIEKN